MRSSFSYQKMCKTNVHSCGNIYNIYKQYRQQSPSPLVLVRQNPILCLSIFYANSFSFQQRFETKRSHAIILFFLSLSLDFCLERYTFYSILLLLFVCLYLLYFIFIYGEYLLTLCLFYLCIFRLH